MKNQILIFASLLLSAVTCLNFNITNMSNCVDVPLDYKNEAEIEVNSITYEVNAQGFADTLHGRFLVHIRRDHKDTELVMIFFKCLKGATGVCNENPKQFTEAVDCKRFLSDASGPWHMFAPALDKRNVCAEIEGEFDITAAKIEGRFLEKYMTVEEGHYRIKFVHHLPGETMESKNLRACVELDFDILG